MRPAGAYGLAMPSPFPGMDPYLERTDLWPGVHNRLANDIADRLNETLPAGLVADLEVRSELLIRDLDSLAAPDEGPARPQTRVADVGVTTEDTFALTENGEAATATLDVPVTTVWPSVECELAHVMVRETDGRRLVTQIALLSPANKRPGRDRTAYMEKKEELLGSDVHLVEIDLLLAGMRAVDPPEAAAAVLRLDASVAYLVTVYPANLRNGTIRVSVYGVRMTDRLPTVAVPIGRERSDRAVVPLALQPASAATYRRGRYAEQIDYTQPLPVRVSETIAEQVRSLGTTPKASG